MNTKAYLNWQRLIAITLCAALLAGCASVPKVSMDAELRRTLMSVAIVEPVEPQQYIVYGASDIPGGFMLYAFGAIGGAMLGTAMAAKAEAQAKSLTASLTPHAPKLGSAFGLALKEEFEKRGVKVSMISTPAVDPETKKLSYQNVSVAEQVIVEPILTILGYRLNAGALRPMVAARMRVLDAQGVKEKYFDIFLYGDKLGDQFVNIPADNIDQFSGLETLYSNGEAAALALRKGTVAIARSAVTAIKN
jgi:hypothetical protein